MGDELKVLAKDNARRSAREIRARMEMKRRLEARDRAYAEQNPDALAARRGRIPTGRINA